MSQNAVSKEVDDRMHAIINNLDPSLARDLRVNNSRKATFDKFRDVCEKLIDSMTAVDDWHHTSGDSDGDVLVNMAVAKSAKDLYNKCKDEALKRTDGRRNSFIVMVQFHGPIESLLYDPTKNDT